MDGKRLYLIAKEPAGPCKIGISYHVKNRLSQLRSSCPDRLALVRTWPIHGSISLIAEKGAHEHLRACRLGGEWFDIGPAQAKAAIDEALRQLRTPGSWLLRHTNLVRERSRHRNGLISGEVQKADSARRADLIRADWPLRTVSTKALLLRAGTTRIIRGREHVTPMAYSIAKRHLGRRPDVQEAHERALAREARKRELEQEAQRDRRKRKT